MEALQKKTQRKTFSDAANCFMIKYQGLCFLNLNSIVEVKRNYFPSSSYIPFITGALHPKFQGLLIEITICFRHNVLMILWSLMQLRCYPQQLQNSISCFMPVMPLTPTNTDTLYEIMINFNKISVAIMF